jgi:sterol desaturase/sphingolipid hydroxylase (fatty acid hydroxylase superfamily)
MTFPHLPDPVKIAIPFFVMLIVLEQIYAAHTKKVDYEPGDTFASLMMGFGNSIVGALIGSTIVGIAVWCSHFKLFTIGNVWWAWLLCIVLDDLLYYAFHRSAHRVRWFWAGHVIHHSSQHYNLSTALRQTWTGFFALSFLFDLPLFFLGFPIEMVFFVGGINLIYQFWIHTEMINRMPRWFEAVMNTPSHHRVHHATNARYLDANYAGIFIIWDKLFGTFVPEQNADPVRYGLVHNISTFNPLRIAFHEWAGIATDVWKSKSISQVLGYLFAPPGWSPDGSRDTSASLKARWRARQAAKIPAE